MSKLESKLIDSMIEVSILGIREKPSLLKSLKKSKPSEEKQNDSFGNLFRERFVHGSRVIVMEKSE